MGYELTLSNWEIVLRLLLATGVGVLFGFERKRSKKPAGVRTHVLVALSACLIALLSAYGFPAAYHYYPAGVNFNVDPARLVVGVLTGIGFIGAGIIWKSPTGVRGITTAAEIFLLAALGICIGLGLYFVAAVVTVIAMLNMIADDVLDLWHRRRNKRRAKEEARREEALTPEDPDNHE